jgi:MFS family permease
VSSPGRSINPTAILIVLCGAQFLDGMDVSTMGPALPRIEADLAMSPTALQWVVSGYVLGYGGFLLLGGRFADLMSRRRLLLMSLVVFAGASLLGGVANDGGVLIAARLVKGIAAAFTGPAALAILLATYREEAARNRALGTYISTAAAGFTLGLVLGGALANASWRLTLFLPAAMATLLLIAAAIVIPRDAPVTGTRGSIDLPGALTITGGVVALVYGVSHAATSSWTGAATLTALLGSLALLAGFVWIESLRQTPLIPLGIFRRSGLAHANALAGMFQGTYVGFQFVATLYYQHVLGWTPLQTGLAFLGGGVLVVLLSARFAAAVTRHGPWKVAALGLMLQALSYLWFTRLDSVDTWALVAVSQLLLGVGYAASYPACNIAAVRNATAEEEGLASGLFIAATQVGSGLLLAIVASVYASNDEPGLEPYRAGAWAVFGLAALAAALGGLALLRRDRSASDAVEPAASSAVP